MLFSLKFWEGVAEGPATVRRSDGTFEEFQYNMVSMKMYILHIYVEPMSFIINVMFLYFSNQGVREGEAFRKMASGETLKFTYVENEINGEATLVRPGLYAKT